MHGVKIEDGFLLNLILNRLYNGINGCGFARGIVGSITLLRSSA